MPKILATAKIANYFQMAAKGKIFCNMFAHIKKRLYICAILNRLACNEPLFAGGWQGLGRGIYRRGNLQAAGSRHNRRKGNTRRRKAKGRKAEKGRKQERETQGGEKRRGEKRGFGEWNDEILKKT